MKVLCCVKQVPDVDQLRMNPETGLLIREGVPSILNPQDEYALSAALWLKENYQTEVTVITMGPPKAEQVLRDCLAVGADAGVLVTDRAFGNADTLATSYSICSAAALVGPFDFVVCGKESLDGATGQMGPQLAERFDMAQATGVVQIIAVNPEAGTVVVRRCTDEGREILELRMPCLLTVEKEGFPARQASIKGKIAAKRKAITVIGTGDIPGLDLGKIGDAGSPTKVPRMFPPPLSEPGILLDDGELGATVSHLLELLREVRI